MKEHFLSNSKELVSQKEWRGFIQSLEKNKNIDNKDKAKNLLKENLTKAIKARASDRFGVLFSGGIDSTIIALILKKAKYNFTCYAVGMENSKDVVSAREVAKELGLKLKVKILDLGDIESTIKEVIKILKSPDVVDVGVGCVFYQAANLAKKDNVNTVFTGLGSEEIFAGYRRHVNAKDIDKACWDGLLNIWKQDLERDYRISSALNVELRTPFLDKDVIKTAMMIPGKFKISRGYKKMILREVALSLGLKKEFAFRKKLAAQYGSRFDKALKKIAKKHGFKYKSEYLKSLV